ncbi:MAG TPA: TIGR03435 family protein [Bryobacteraceae bacterium]|nr:TIGR03435 family protein [Bryobacteraceae bacterium]
MTVSAGAVFAQDITGAWQGTMSLSNNGAQLRIVIRISKDDAGALKAALQSVDQSPQTIGGTVTLQGSSVKMAIAGIGASYEGKLDSDGVNISGTFTQGGAPLALNLKHVTGDEIWAPAAPLKRMPADAVAEFGAASIKPSDPAQQGKGITIRGSEFRTINTSLIDLITFAYGVHPKQIAGGPSWMSSDKFDTVAKLDQGIPSDTQAKAMLQKLLTDRFQLAFHREKRELSVYALVAGKNGAKISKSAGDPNGLPGLGFRALGDMIVNNAKITDFTGLMQSMVLDRPVVDQTGLQGRWDFTLKWTPDEFQFAGLGMKPPAPSDTAAAPDLFTAIQDQLGLKLESTKATVDVLVVDKAEKPAN